MTDEQMERRSRTWHPRQKWTVQEAAEILHVPTPYAKSLTKAIIGLDWSIAEQGRKESVG